ncbi:histone deacetylase HDT2-like isoform X2 [Papaver somniferum]|uniref:histone deacetylase HDT2-like isoform X2 n=1 Tax=Papaver somniferum TaxID=3469 RepID=UPI000E6FB350|nr:histone deacetylase HDT2-like isoform X2 [Papaver somniferum]
MEFWGVEVKPGQSYKVAPVDEKVLHLSQSCIGEVKKGKEETVVVYAKIDNQKHVIAHLSADKFPQISHDLVFEKEFELSHSSKNGSIYFTGYMSVLGDESNLLTDSDEDDMLVEDFPVDIKENGKAAKPDASAAKKVKVVDPKADDEDDSDESDSDGSDSDEDEDMEGSDSDDGESSDEEEEPTPTPKGKKRPAEGASKKSTPGDKKAKVETPQKSGADGKKGGAVHQGTPYPKGGKTPASGGNNKSNKSPKSTGAFGTDSALQAHSKAKHVK